MPLHFIYNALQRRGKSNYFMPHLVHYKLYFIFSHSYYTATVVKTENLSLSSCLFKDLWRLE